METILGIDLGTTNSVVSVIRGGKPQVLAPDGEKLLPSIVGLDSQGNLLVGAPARNQWTLAPDRTIRSIKRKMGSDETIALGDQVHTPQEISAMILRTLREQAARQLGEDIRRAVITVPAFFNERQREATREAGELAGLEVLRIINEPTAASLTYHPQDQTLERLLVYDLGGGTFDVSIVQIEQGVVEVLSSHGDTQLGGDDFDQLLLDHVCDAFQKEHGIDPRETLATRSRVLRAVEAAKCRLSFEPFTDIEEEFLCEVDGVPRHLRMELARDEYENLIEGLLQKTLVCVDEALTDARLRANQIDRVVLVGGASRTPMVHRLLAEQLGQPIHLEVDPDLCVSMGAAIQGGLMSGLDLGPVLVDITPHTLGVACIGLVHGMPSPHAFAPLIQRNTPLPATRSEVFETHLDGQRRVLISVCQGEHEDARLNEPVGELQLEGLSDVPAGNPILVRFHLDLDGILTASAIEKTTGLSATATIENAISRFRDEDHDAARQRLEKAFGSEATIVEAGSSQTASAVAPAGRSNSETFSEPVTPEVAKLLAQGRELIAKSERLAGEAQPQDAEDIARASEQLEQALAAQSADEIRARIEQLDDLLFYLQDV